MLETNQIWSQHLYFEVLMTIAVSQVTRVPTTPPGVAEAIPGGEVALVFVVLGSTQSFSNQQKKQTHLFPIRLKLLFVHGKRQARLLFH